MKKFKLAVSLSIAFIIAIMCSFTAGAKVVDVDGDGEIQISDVTEIQKVLAGISQPADNFFDVADATEDGKVDIDDVTYIQKYIAGLIEDFSDNFLISEANLNLKVGEEHTIAVSGDCSNLNWESSNQMVASVRKDAQNTAVIMPIMQGETTITATASNGQNVSCTVTVSGSVVKCLDVSTWQGSNIDFNKVKADGIEYVILRAGYGEETYQKDDTFDDNYEKAKAAGLKVGAYWFSYSMSVEESEREADACLYCLGNKEFDLPVYYDMEYVPAIQNLDSETYTKMAERFCDKIKDAGYKPGVYASASVHEYPLDYNTISSKYSIWNAEWNDTYTVKCDVWQYTDDGTVNGISGKVDLSYIFNLNILN